MTFQFNYTSVVRTMYKCIIYLGILFGNPELHWNRFCFFVTQPLYARHYYFHLHTPLLSPSQILNIKLLKWKWVCFYVECCHNRGSVSENISWEFYFSLLLIYFFICMVNLYRYNWWHVSKEDDWTRWFHINYILETLQLWNLGA